MWPETTGVPSALNRSRNQGLTSCRPELVTEPTGMNRTPDRWTASMPSNSGCERSNS